MSNATRRWGCILLALSIVNLAAGVAHPDWPIVTIAELLLVLGVVWAIGTTARLAWGPVA